MTKAKVADIVEDCESSWLSSESALKMSKPLSDKVYVLFAQIPKLQVCLVKELEVQ